MSNRGGQAARATPQHGHIGGQAARSTSQHSIDSISGTIIVISGSQIPLAEHRALPQQSTPHPHPAQSPPSSIGGPQVATPPTASGTKSTGFPLSKGGTNQNPMSLLGNGTGSSGPGGHRPPNAPNTVRNQASGPIAAPIQASAPIAAPPQTPGDSLMGPGPTKVDGPNGDGLHGRNPGFLSPVPGPTPAPPVSSIRAHSSDITNPAPANIGDHRGDGPLFVASRYTPPISDIIPQTGQPVPLADQLRAWYLSRWLLQGRHRPSPSVLDSGPQGVTANYLSGQPGAPPITGNSPPASSSGAHGTPAHYFSEAPPGVSSHPLIHNSGAQGVTVADTENSSRFETEAGVNKGNSVPSSEMEA